MAQLPPKAPSMTTQNRPGFCSEKISNDATNGISWVDDFLDFSSSRRGSHRRSISDSIAFLETPIAEECRRSSIPGGDQFERFDDEQLMSMFVDDSLSPSDHYSLNGEDKSSPSDQLRQLNLQPKNEPEESDRSCKLEGQIGLISATRDEDSGDKISDPKRIKRILANRQSAQRSRVRKLQYISELERNVSSLQAEVSVLSPRVAFLDHQRLVLNVDNSVLKQRIAALAQDKLFKDAHQEALKSEIERLNQIYCQQNRQKMENSGGPMPKSPQIFADISAETEQLAV